MKKIVKPVVLALLLGFVLFTGCDTGGGGITAGEASSTSGDGSWLQSEGAAPSGTNLITNGEFDDIFTGELPEGDYNNWNNWSVVFNPTPTAWSSMFYPGEGDSGYGAADMAAVISWGPKNYSFILTQDLGTLDAGTYQGAMMVLVGSGSYDEITLEVIGDDDGTLGSFTAVVDNTIVSEVDSNDVTWQEEHWARVLCDVSVPAAQTATFRVKVVVGEGGSNAYTRVDDIFLVSE